MQEDRRIRKTRKALYDALVELLRDRELRLIPVQTLCDLADIHRATFYYHYTDIYALYEELENRTLSELTSAVIADETHTYTAVYHSVLTHIHDNAKVWTVLLSGHGSRDFHDKVAAILEDRFLEICKYETGRTTFPEALYLLAEFETSGLLTMIDRWLKTGTVLSVDFITGMIRNIDQAMRALMDTYLTQEK